MKKTNDIKEWESEEWKLWGNNQQSKIIVSERKSERISTEILEVIRNNSKVTLRELNEQFQISSTDVTKHWKTALETLSNEKEAAEDREQLIAKAIDRRQMLENAFKDHELSRYLTYEKFIDVCISKKKAFTTTWRSCAISNQAIKAGSNYLKAVRSAVADCEMLIKGINHGNGGAAWIRTLLRELKSAADTPFPEKDRKERRK